MYNLNSHKCPDSDWQSIHPSMIEWRHCGCNQNRDGVKEHLEYLIQISNKDNITKQSLLRSIDNYLDTHFNRKC